MAVQVSHPSAFKGYKFAGCPACGRNSLYKGVTRNPAQPMQFVRCRTCGFEEMGILPNEYPGLRSI